jgi:hypothetical protein
LTHQTDEKMELTYETCKAAAAYYESRGFVTEIFAAPFEGYKLGIEFRDPHGKLIFVWVDSYEIEEIEQKTK